MSADGPTSSTCSDSLPIADHAYSRKIPSRTTAVEEIDRPRERNHECVGGRPHHETDLEALARVDDELVAARPPAVDEDHHGPAEADQQPVRPGHVGHGIGRVARVLARLPGEVEVHRVLRQHGHQRQHQDRERLRDVALGELGAPGEQEGAAQDREPRERGGDLVRQPQAMEMVDDHPGQRERRRAEERHEIALPRAGRRSPSHQNPEPNSRS